MMGGFSDTVCLWLTECRFRLNYDGGMRSLSVLYSITAEVLSEGAATIDNAALQSPDLSGGDQCGERDQPHRPTTANFSASSTISTCRS